MKYTMLLLTEKGLTRTSSCCFDGSVEEISKIVDSLNYTLRMCDRFDLQYVIVPKLAHPLAHKLERLAS